MPEKTTEKEANGRRVSYVDGTKRKKTCRLKLQKESGGRD